LRRPQDGRADRRQATRILPRFERTRRQDRGITDQLWPRALDQQTQERPPVGGRAFFQRRSGRDADSTPSANAHYRPRSASTVWPYRCWGRVDVARRELIFRRRDLLSRGRLRPMKPSGERDTNSGPGLKQLLRCFKRTTSTKNAALDAVWSGGRRDLPLRGRSRPVKPPGERNTNSDPGLNRESWFKRTTSTTKRGGGWFLVPTS